MDCHEEVKVGSRLRTNYVLVDFENVQPKNMELLQGGPFKVKVFLSSTQAKIPLGVASALQVFGTDAEYIQIEGSGNNALDFHIAYYIGRLAAETPDAYFHIISKDTGFDPLIKHLKIQKIYCQRSVSINDIPLLKISNAKSVAEKVEAIIDNLVKRKASKPRTVKTLGGSIKALFVNQLGDDELDSLVEQLVKRGVVKVSDGKVTYDLPSE
jgi:hypothetical protein